jgi:uncharacterized protein
MESSTARGRPAVYISGYIGLWAATLALLRVFGMFDASEAIAAFVILGVIFPGLAWLCTRNKPLSMAVHRPNIELLVLIGYLFALACVIVYGFGLVGRIAEEPLHSIVLLGLKLLAFVIVPAALISIAGSYTVKELVPFSLRWRELRPALWMSVAAVLMQALIGRGWRDLRLAHPPAQVLLVAAPLAFLWLTIEVGIVEEFYFRVLLQERLAASLHSSWGGLVVAALLFGFVHAPGFYLRPAGAQEALGPHPSLLMAIGYSIVLTSLAGIFLGVLWMRTKNFAIVAIVHAAGDLLPNLLPWARSFHLMR